MKKIIFLDLDGTLWTFEKIPSSALEAIELEKKPIKSYKMICMGAFHLPSLVYISI